MTEPTPIATQRPPARQPSREVQNAEQQIASVDDQLAEMVSDNETEEMQIEAMLDQIRKTRKSITARTRRMEKLANRRAVFIEASAALRKLERP